MRYSYKAMAGLSRYLVEVNSYDGTKRVIGKVNKVKRSDGYYWVHEKCTSKYQLFKTRDLAAKDLERCIKEGEPA